MCFGFGTITNTTVNINGHSMRMHSNSMSPFGSFNSYSSFSPGCFGYGFNPTSGCGFSPMYGNPMMIGAGMGLGFAVGNMLPGIFKGIGKGCSWLWNNAIAPAGIGIGKAASWVWNKALVPAGKAIGKGVSWAVGKAWDGISWAGSKAWDGIKWASGKIWDGISWVGRKIGEGAKKLFGKKD